MRYSLGYGTNMVSDIQNQKWAMERSKFLTFTIKLSHLIIDWFVISFNVNICDSKDHNLASLL